jgi:hypothetical protein
VIDHKVGLHPDLLTKLTQLEARMLAVGHPVACHAGIRTAEEQRQLWRQGRVIPGPNVSAAHPKGLTVTECDGYENKSNHQPHADGFGHAADYHFTIGDPFAATQPWATFGSVAESLGLKWGGRFPKVDLDHVEMA